MWADLDIAELEEVSRRVVTPVVEAMMRPGELTGVDVGVGQPPAWPCDADDTVGVPIVWVHLRAADDELVVRLGATTMERWRAEDVAVALEAAIDDWVVVSSFGWGEQRQGPAELPPADDAPGVLRF